MRHIKITMIFILWFMAITAEAQTKFLLTTSEMPNFELTGQAEVTWTVGYDPLQQVKGTTQNWRGTGEAETEETYIDYCEFSDESAALQGTSFESSRHSIPFRWGGPEYLVVGDASWMSYDGGGLLFVRGNVGIKIGVRGAKLNLVQVRLVSLAKLLLTKIESNLSPAVVASEASGRQQRVPRAEYLNMTSTLLNSAILTGYALHEERDSKWLINAKRRVLGIRQIWKTNDGKIIDVDICKYASAGEAQQAIIFNNKRLLANQINNLDGLDSLKMRIAQFKSHHSKKNSEFIFGIKNNVTLQLHHFDPDSIDWDFLYNVVEILADQIVNF